jgi:GxxExxY protein|tara:strand:+ start:36702 stop:37145 length:444 start_codon:yes stop_codon:yes gene_type:complete
MMGSLLLKIWVEPQRAQRFILLEMEKLNKLSKVVIGEAIEVHKELEPGLLELADQACLFYSLTEKGLNVEKEKAMPIMYKNVELDCGYRIDLLVERELVVELKAVEELNNIHIAQVMSYLKMSNFRLGLLLNFNVKYLKQGIKRIIN